jgi:DNA-damage-inducible protein D
LKFLAPDGKMRPTDCANTEGVLRIIQSIPSPKAEPFRLWMADLSKQAIQEIADPELMTQRQAEIYRTKGYSEDWSGERLKTPLTSAEN